MILPLLFVTVRRGNHNIHTKMAPNYSPELLAAMTNKDKELSSVLIELKRQSQALTKKDIGMWRSAWQMAIDIENPSRSRLYDIYTDNEIDGHLSGCITQRTGMVKSKAFKLTKDGKEDKLVTEIFEQDWFKEFVRLALESIYWGHSLIQFGDVSTEAGKRRFRNVELVPRKHVIPEYGVIVVNVGDNPKKGISYREGLLSEWVIEAGQARNLGLYLKCCPHCISKKNMLGFWDGFGELFGMPIRIAKTSSRDAKDIDKIENMMAGMGTAAWGIFPEGTELEIKESSKGDAFNVYDRRILRANSELSKMVLAQTMTIDDGSSRSQGEVHLEILQNIITEDADFIRDLVNNKLMPFMLGKGFPVDGFQFDWDDTEEISSEAMQGVEKMLLDAGYEIEPKYFVEKYNIPIAKKKSESLSRFFD